MKKKLDYQNEQKKNKKPDPELNKLNAVYIVKKNKSEIFFVF